MATTTSTPQQLQTAQPSWVLHATQLWERRRLLARITLIAAVLSLAIACLIPKRYTSGASIMPPEQQGSGAMMLAALTGKAGALGGLGSLAGGLLGSHSNSDLFVELLRSGTISGHLIERFQLQHVYRKRYLVDTAKVLARRTTVAEDKKSGVISLSVEDTDPTRARDLAQAYLDELNQLVNRTSISSAHQERLFIERRLASVSIDLEAAQQGLSEFSSRNSTVDIGTQTRAMVDAAARLQAEMLVEQSGLGALRQIYGDGNTRVRETQARITTLERELAHMSGTSAPLNEGVADGTTSSLTGDNTLYPPLRQLPRLAVPYANFYRRVKVQETVFELLTQQYEIARMEEAKDVPVVSVIDAPGIPEKKSFPPRILLTAGLTFLTFIIASACILMQLHWRTIPSADPRKHLAHTILSALPCTGANR